MEEKSFISFFIYSRSC